jgi:hypothetical protein
MGDRISAIDPLKDTRWGDFVQKHPMSSVYHHSAWFNLINSTFNYLPRCYALIDDETGCLKGVFPFMTSSSVLKRGRLVSLPYATYCDPLLPTERIVETLEHVVQTLPGAPRVELRLSGDLAGIPNDLEKASLYINHTVDLSGSIDSVFQKLHKSCVQRRIKKAQKCGLTLRFAESEKDIEKIYSLLLKLRKSKGLPPHPYKFFLNMWEILGPQNMLFAPYAVYQNKVVSAAIILKFNTTIYYEYGASDPAYQNLGSNQFLLWEVMKLGHEMGAQAFDLGRSHFENHNLIQFKDRLGGKRTDLTYYYLPKRPLAKSINETMMSFGGSLNKLLPNLILRLEGELIYRFLR